MFERNEPEISQILEESLEAVLSGKASIEEVLKQHPQYDDELRKALETSVWLNSKRNEINERPGFIVSSQKRVLAKIHQEASNRGTKRAFLSFFALSSRPAYFVAATLAILLLFFTGLGSAVSHAQAAVPGQRFYALKRVSEQAVYVITLDRLNKIELLANFADRRLGETETLISTDKINLAEDTIAVFLDEVDLAVDQLEQVPDQNILRKKAAASQLHNDLTNQASRLEGLWQRSPEEVRPTLMGALGATMNNAADVIDVIESIDESLGTMTSTPSPTHTITQTMTVTASPTKTLRLQMTETPQPADQSSDESTEDPDPDEKISKTPKPTNENRRIDPGKPTPKDTKPPNDNKPTNSGKKDN